MSNKPEILSGPSGEKLVRTGEFRIPVAGEWFVTERGPVRAKNNFRDCGREILRPATAEEIAAEASCSRASAINQNEVNEMNAENITVSINNPDITFYGPHPCDICGGGPIVRGSVNQGFGDIRLNSPNEPIYPNHKWQEHHCECRFQVGQDVEWDGQQGICTGKIASITESSPGSYVLWIGDDGDGFPINSIEARRKTSDEIRRKVEQFADELFTEPRRPIGAMPSAYDRIAVSRVFGTEEEVRAKLVAFASSLLSSEAAGAAPSAASEGQPAPMVPTGVGNYVHSKPGCPFMYCDQESPFTACLEKCRHE